jgi:uncharacterized protein YkwD
MVPTLFVGKRDRLVENSSMIRLWAAAFVCSIFIGAVALTGCANDNNPPPAGQPSFYQSLASPDAKLDANTAQSMISGYRSNNGLGPVVIDPELMQLAADQARAMAAHDKLDHSASHPFQQRLQQSSFNAGVAVENIGAGYDTLAEAFSGWRDSPPHRANMLNRDVTRMGIAAAYAPQSRYKVFWSLILAKPNDQHTG